MRPSRLADEGIDVLRRRLEEDGYLLLRSLIPREAVDAARRRLAAQVHSAGWLVPGSPPEALAVDAKTLEWDSAHPPDELGGMDAQELLHEPVVSRVLEAPELSTFFAQLFGEPAVTFDFKWFRMVRPWRNQGVHCDRIYMGRGSSSLHTVWIPWQDTPVSLGGLALIAGSHRLSGFARVRDTYGSYDTQRDGVIQDNPQQDGWLSNDPTELLRFDDAARWVTADYYPGDCVVFPMHTLHGSTLNQSAGTLRLSCDVRYQPASHAHDERYSVGAQSREEQARVDAARAATWNSAAGGAARERSMIEARRAWGIPPPPPLTRL
jgi:hypothetical protein